MRSVSSGPARAVRARFASSVDVSLKVKYCGNIRWLGKVVHIFSKGLRVGIHRGHAVDKRNDDSGSGG